MAPYSISLIYCKEDVQQIAGMSACSTWTDPLLNTIIPDADGVSWESWKSCRDLAEHNYSRWLDDSNDKPLVHSWGWKISFDTEPHVIEASALLQHFNPDPDCWHMQWKEDRSNFDVPPICVDGNLHRHIENILHTDRKTFMQGREHIYLGQLDFKIASSHRGKEAAEYLLAKFIRTKYDVDKYAHSTSARHDLMKESGWEFVGPVLLMPAVAQNGDFVTFPQTIGSWVLRGLLAPPPKPRGADLHQPPFVI